MNSIYVVLISALVFSAVGLSGAEDADSGIEGSEEAYSVEITNASWVEEWVEISNLGEAAQDLTGWTLKDEQEHAYAFPEGFVIEPGARVMVHTDVGNDTTTDLYWNMGNPIWNNAGDVATLMDDEGEVVSQYPELQDDQSDLEDA